MGGGDGFTYRIYIMIVNVQKSIGKLRVLTEGFLYVFSLCDTKKIIKTHTHLKRMCESDWTCLAPAAAC